MKRSSFVYVIVGLIILLGLFFILRPKTNQQNVTTPTSALQQSSAPKEKVFEYLVKENKIISGDQVIKVAQGDEVVLRVTVDKNEQLHLHGYDKFTNLQKDIPGEIRFNAELAGRYVLELELSAVELGALEVLPK